MDFMRYHHDPEYRKDLGKIVRFVKRWGTDEDRLTVDQYVGK